MNKTLVFDIETDGLDPSVIHIIGIYDYSTNTYTSYDLEEVPKGVDHLNTADVLVGHNIIGYDLPVLKKFFPNITFKAQIIDTLALARMIYTDIYEIDAKLIKAGILPKRLMGRHSLEAYGFRLGEQKDDFHTKTDWQKWSKEMSKYCEQDVITNKKLYEKLMSKDPSEQAINLEMKTTVILQRQKEYGFLFDVEKAEAFYLELIGRREELHKELVEAFGTWVEPKGKPTVPKRNNQNRGIKAGCAYQNIQVVEFNPNSRTHIRKRLKAKYNWKPKEFTEKGTPKVDEEVLSQLTEYPEAELLTEYLLLGKRIGMLAEGNSAWLKCVHEKDNRIRGSVISSGTVTGRMSHSNPNIAQVPAVYAPYGKQSRELFTVPEGKLLVGCDASGLELRCLAHYMFPYDKGAYAKEVTEGDIHSHNQKMAGLPTRDNAKTFIYGFLYGAGDEKIGSIVNGTRTQGKKLREQFLRELPALDKLQRDVKRVARNRKYLIGLDGRRLKVRSLHSALNLLLQSAGAIIMKQALVILDETLQETLRVGIDYEFVANVHDEWQIECYPELSEFVGQKAVQAIERAGEVLDFRCPLTGEYKIGRNWAETH